MKKYIHYGSDHFDEGRFMPIKNDILMGLSNKPLGGLWSSDKNAEFGWKDWCKSEDFYLERLKKHFEFTLRNEARILRIDSCNILQSLPEVNIEILPSTNKEIFEMYNSRFSRLKKYFLDFECIAKKYDAIEVLISKDYNLYYALYGWDCDTLLVMNPDVMIFE
jgi:hypothetical protein